MHVVALKRILDDPVVGPAPLPPPASAGRPSPPACSAETARPSAPAGSRGRDTPWAHAPASGARPAVGDRLCARRRSGGRRVLFSCGSQSGIAAGKCAA
jgi:hypothetical protein